MPHLNLDVVNGASNLINKTLTTAVDDFLSFLNMNHLGIETDSLVSATNKETVTSNSNNATTATGHGKKFKKGKLDRYLEHRLQSLKPKLDYLESVGHKINLK